MALLGVLARVQVADRELTIEQLAEIDGVSTFPVEDDERLGILIEADKVNRAHEILTTEVDRLPGVLGTWPVFNHFESDSPYENTQLSSTSANSD